MESTWLSAGFGQGSSNRKCDGRAGLQRRLAFYGGARQTES